MKAIIIILFIVLNATAKETAVLEYQKLIHLVDATQGDNAKNIKSVSAFVKVKKKLDPADLIMHLHDRNILKQELIVQNLKDLKRTDIDQLYFKDGFKYKVQIPIDRLKYLNYVIIHNQEAQSVQISFNAFSVGDAEVKGNKKVELPYQDLIDLVDATQDDKAKKMKSLDAFIKVKEVPNTPKFNLYLLKEGVNKEVLAIQNLKEIKRTDIEQQYFDSGFKYKVVIPIDRIKYKNYVLTHNEEAQSVRLKFELTFKIQSEP
jgi:hypothetical protein